MKIFYIYTIIVFLSISSVFSQNENAEYDPYGQNLKAKLIVKKTDTIIPYFRGVNRERMIYSIRTGIYSPLGKQKETLSETISFSFKYGLFVDSTSNIIGLNLSIIPTNSYSFKYSDGDTSFTTKAKMIVSIGFYYETKTKIYNKLYINNYFGTGVNFLITNTLEPQTKSCKKQEPGTVTLTYGNTNTNETCSDGNSRYKLTTLNLNIGMGIEYRVFSTCSVEYFVELNFNTYSESSKLTDFGNTNLTSGLSFNF